jgi:hypothetical protein
MKESLSLSTKSIKDIYESVRRRESVLSNPEVPLHDEQLLEGIEQPTISVQQPIFGPDDTLALNDTI